ncbi:MAG TPA: tRNA uridine-5-carboxymethylaminomethyl(34) synthesis GTPase MnmE [Vicinamibacterales bacterium]|nr:tRNA uridine-5-carboxymethylaminomethyl(34) synthesis GTPase MnmE [Vicinamibacterales bacterium]
MFSTSDTIVAIATPPGRGGIGVVRVSGGDAPRIAAALLELSLPLRPRHATFARVMGDQVVATYFPAPHSYTGEHVVEISAHGSPIVLGQIVQDAMHAGARLAEPGEFTLRAFLNGRIDLIQAEAVADLIDAVTPEQARAAFDQLEGTLTENIAEIERDLFDLTARMEASLDFPDEGYHFVEAGDAAAALGAIESKVCALLCEFKRGRLIREGARVAIAGKPNVGKSSLFNALVGAGRAIVTAVPGTTRDLVTETADIEGLRLELVDTAGIREPADEVELEGVMRARRAWTTADLVLVVLDSSRPLEEDDLGLLGDTTEVPRLVVMNKSDLPGAWAVGDLRLAETVAVVSTKSENGLDALRKQLRMLLDRGVRVGRDTAAVTNIRHAALLDRARAALGRARESVEAPGGPVPEEFVLTDLQDARAALEEVTGKRTSEDLLRHIFSRFCIGK